MTSIRTKFRPSSINGKEGTIYYQLIHDRKVKHLSTRYRIFPSEWDIKRDRLAPIARGPRAATLTDIRMMILCDTDRLSRIIKAFDKKGIAFTCDDISEEFERISEENSLFSFMGRMISSLKNHGKVRTAETYRATLASFTRYRDGNDIMLDAFSDDTARGYEAYLRNNGLALNTISFYLNRIRAVYNRAVETEVTDQRYPFRHVFTGIEKTAKRALPLDSIQRIKRLDLSSSPREDFARDMFMLSFYLRGMSFVDMAYLRKCDLKNGIITYRRRKTGQTLTIAWTHEMQEILDKYPANITAFLLPIITKPKINERNAYRRMGYIINRNLKKAAVKAGIIHPVTMYCARHSWASIARGQGIPLRIISEGMGHDSETTTQIYLASLDATAVDQANEMIIKSL